MIVRFPFKTILEVNNEKVQLFMKLTGNIFGRKFSPAVALHVSITCVSKCWPCRSSGGSAGPLTIQPPGSRNSSAVESILYLIIKLIIKKLLLMMRFHEFFLGSSIMNMFTRQ